IGKGSDVATRGEATALARRAAVSLDVAFQFDPGHVPTGLLGRLAPFLSAGDHGNFAFHPSPLLAAAYPSPIEPNDAHLLLSSLRRGGGHRRAGLLGLTVGTDLPRFIG